MIICCNAVILGSPLWFCLMTQSAPLWCYLWILHYQLMWMRHVLAFQLQVVNLKRVNMIQRPNRWGQTSEMSPWLVFHQRNPAILWRRLATRFCDKIRYQVLKIHSQTHSEFLVVNNSSWTNRYNNVSFFSCPKLGKTKAKNAALDAHRKKNVTPWLCWDHSCVPSRSATRKLWPWSNKMGPWKAWKSTSPRIRSGQIHWLQTKPRFLNRFRVIIVYQVLLLHSCICWTFFNGCPKSLSFLEPIQF